MNGKDGVLWAGVRINLLRLKHDMRGVVSMASSKPDRVGSQFFITYAPQPHLDGVQTVCGKLLFGWDTLDKMELARLWGRSSGPRPHSRWRVTIHANPFECRKIIQPPQNRVEPDPIKPKKKKKKKKTEKQQC